MKKSLAILILAASSALAQMAGTNYVTVMFDRSDNKFYPQGATDFVTNNAGIQDLQSAVTQEAQARGAAIADEAATRSAADLELSNRIDDVSDRAGDLGSDVSEIRLSMQDTEDNLSGGPLFADFVWLTNFWNSAVSHTYAVSDAKTVGNVVADVAQSERVNCVVLQHSKFTDFRSSDPELTIGDVRFISSDNISVQSGDPMALDSGKYPPSDSFGVWWNDVSATTGYWGYAVGNYEYTIPIKKTYSGFKHDTNYVYRGVSGLRAKIDNEMQAARMPAGKDMAPFKTVNTNGVFTTGIGSFVAFSNAVIHFTTNLSWNTNLWCYGVIDLSPVSFGWIDRAKVGTTNWTFDQHATLITPQHIVTAAHWHAPVGKELVFLDKNNNVHYRTLTKAVSKTNFTGKADHNFGDLCVGMLNAPILDIEPAKILHPDDYGKLLLSITNMYHPGFSTYMVPRSAEPHMGTNKFMGYAEAVHFRLNAVRSVWFHIDGVPFSDASSTSVATIDAKTNSLHRYYTYGGDWGRYGKYVNTNNYNFIGGDSSTPILMSINGQTVVTHCLWTTSGSGPNLSYHRNDIEDQLRAWGGEYTTLPRLDLSGWPDVSNP